MQDTAPVIRSVKILLSAAGGTGHPLDRLDFDIVLGEAPLAQRGAILENSRSAGSFPVVNLHALPMAISGSVGRARAQLAHRIDLDLRAAETSAPIPRELLAQLTRIAAAHLDQLAGESEIVIPDVAA